jgi:hypothetical protein
MWTIPEHTAVWLVFVAAMWVAWRVSERFDQWQAAGGIMTLTPTTTTAEAMALLKAQRKALIDMAREEAKVLAQANGGIVHTRMIHEAMLAKGLLDNPDIKDYWLGAVFNGNPDFEDTGKTILPPKPKGRSTNIHAWRPVKLWRLKGYKAQTSNVVRIGDLFAQGRS